MSSRYSMVFFLYSQKKHSIFFSLCIVCFLAFSYKLNLLSSAAILGDLNSEFSFSYISYHTKVKTSDYPIILPIAGGSIHVFIHSPCYVKCKQARIEFVLRSLCTFSMATSRPPPQFSLIHFLYYLLIHPFCKYYISSHSLLHKSFVSFESGSSIFLMLFPLIYCLKCFSFFFEIYCFLCIVGYCFKSTFLSQHFWFIFSKCIVCATTWNLTYSQPINESIYLYISQQFRSYLLL